jgi:predicted amidohydrolase
MRRARPVKVTGIQCDLVWEDASANHARLRPRIEAAGAAGARLIVLPEMWPSGFSMATERVAEEEGGASERFLAEMARVTGAAVGGSIAQVPAGAGGNEVLPPLSRVAGGRPRNVFVLATADGGVHRYAKIHPFSFGTEPAHYDAGTEVVTVDVGGVRVTPLICYDLRFPELFAAVAARTDLFLVVASWPEARVGHFTALLAARAIETQAFVLGVNRVGAGGGLVYTGGSRLISPLGVVVDAAEPSAPAERDISGDVDPAEVAAVRAKFPFLADRRPGVYRALRGEG